MPIEITVLEPKAGAAFSYQRIAPSSTGGPQARISLTYRLRNIGPATVTIKGILLAGKPIDGWLKTAKVPDTLGPGQVLDLQNCMDAHEFTDAQGQKVVETWDDIVRVDEPLQGTSLEVWEDVVDQVIAVPLAEHVNSGGPLHFPGRGEDLGVNEAWAASSHHSSGHQAFALDVGMQGWTGTKWSKLRTGSKAERPQDWRVYGMPLFAMASGTVGFAVGDQPDWQTLTESQAVYPKSKTLGFGTAGGNGIFVISGNEMSFYGHLQMGSLPPELLQTGAPVKRGQYLGKVGFSGATSEPHFHIHVKTKPAAYNPNLPQQGNNCDWGLYRPMGFARSWTVPMGKVPTPDAGGAGAWYELKNQSVSHEFGFLAAGSKPPAFSATLTDAARYLGLWHGGTHLDLAVVRRGAAAFAHAYDRFVADSFTLTALETYEENGVPTFLGVFRRGTAVQALSRHTSWTAFAADVKARAAEGLALRDVTTYVDKGIRTFSGVFSAGPGGGTVVRTTAITALEQAVTTAAKAGLRPVALHTYAEGATRYFVVGLTKSAETAVLLRDTGLDSFSGQANALAAKGRRLADVISWPVVGGRAYVGIVRPDAEAATQVVELHHGLGPFRRWSEVHAADRRRLTQVHVQ